MVLHELHVLQRSTGAIGQRHAIAILDVGVRCERENTPAAARAKDDGVRGDGLDLSRHQFDRHRALHASVVH